MNSNDDDDERFNERTNDSTNERCGMNEQQRRRTNERTNSHSNLTLLTVPLCRAAGLCRWLGDRSPPTTNNPIALQPTNQLTFVLKVVFLQLETNPHERTKERTNEATNERTKERTNEGRKERTNEGTKEGRKEGRNE